MKRVRTKNVHSSPVFFSPPRPKPTPFRPNPHPQPAPHTMATTFLDLPADVWEKIAHELPDAVPLLARPHLQGGLGRPRRVTPRGGGMEKMLARDRPVRLGPRGGGTHARAVQGFGLVIRNPAPDLGPVVRLLRGAYSALVWPRARSRRTGGGSRRRRPSSLRETFRTQLTRQLPLQHPLSRVCQVRRPFCKVCRPLCPPPSTTRRRQALSTRRCPGAQSRAGRGRGGERRRRGPRVRAHRHTKKP